MAKPAPLRHDHRLNSRRRPSATAQQDAPSSARSTDRQGRRAADKDESGAMQAGARRYPAPPLPDQHLKKPGREADLELKPMYDAPHYKGSDKLLDKVALITGGDSGIGRAVAVLFAREGADVAIAYLDEARGCRRDQSARSRTKAAAASCCRATSPIRISARPRSRRRSTSSASSTSWSTTPRSRSTSTASRI